MSILLHSPLVSTELANTRAILEQEEQSKRVVQALYGALRSKVVDEVHRLLAPDLEWWFHGPPDHQHLMRILTGASPDDPFLFFPLSIVAFGSRVFVEGYNKERSVSWVHAWTVTDGIIIQVREYYNTSVTVTRFGLPAQSLKCQNVWQSKLSDRIGKSVPGLVLAL